MGTTLKITAKGQVTLRKEALRHLGVCPGDEIVVDLLSAGRAALRPSTTGGSIERFIGCLRRPGEKSVSTEEIDEIIAQSWAGHR